MQAALASRPLAMSAVARPAGGLAAAPSRTAVVVVESKLKTRKAAAKRFRVTGGGKVMGRHAGKQHMNEKMSTNQKRDLSGAFMLAPGDAYAVAKELPYARI